MDWETHRRVHDFGVYRASQQYGLTFGPDALKRLDELDSRIASTTADITYLRRELGQTGAAIAAEHNFKQREQCCLVEREQSQEEPTNNADTWHWWDLPAPPSPPREEDSPQRKRYPDRSPVQLTLRDVVHANSTAKASFDRLSRRLEPHRLKRSRWLEARTTRGRACLREGGERLERIEVTWPPLERFENRQREIPEAEKQDAIQHPHDPKEQDQARGAPALPSFLRDHPSRLAGHLCDGFKISAMRHAHLGSGSTVWPPPVLATGESAESESSVLQCGKGPTQLQWVAHCDRELTARMLLGLTARKSTQDHSALMP